MPRPRGLKKLIDAPAGIDIWSETYDCELADLLWDQALDLARKALALSPHNYDAHYTRLCEPGCG